MLPADLRRVFGIVGVRWDLVVGTLLVFASAWGFVAAPWLIGKAVNDLQRGSTESLALLALGVAGAGLLTAVCTCHSPNRTRSVPSPISTAERAGVTLISHRIRR